MFKKKDATELVAFVVLASEERKEFFEGLLRSLSAKVDLQSGWASAKQTQEFEQQIQEFEKRKLLVEQVQMCDLLGTLDQSACQVPATDG